MPNVLLEKSREIDPEDEKAEPKWKQSLAVDKSGGKSKEWCCKEQHCIGTWEVRSMNEGKLEVVKQEIQRVNIKESVNQNEPEWVDLIQMTIIPTTVDKNLLEEMQ